MINTARMIVAGLANQIIPIATALVAPIQSVRKLEDGFDIADLGERASDWAFARTNLAATVTVNATGVKSAEANQELLIFRKGADDRWKTARYSFSTTDPVRQ